TDARLVVDVVGAHEGRELAEQIRAFVGLLGRAEPVDRVRPVGGADLLELVADLVDRGLPRDLLPLAVDQLEGVAQPAIAVHQLTRRSTLGAVRAAADRAVPARLLADPHTVHHLGDDGAADRAVRADVLPGGDLRACGREAGLGLAHAGE